MPPKLLPQQPATDTDAPDLTVSKRPDRSRRWAPVSLTLLLGFSRAFGTDISFIALHYRSAEELAPLLAPLIGPGETLVPHDDQLIIRADPATITDIKALLEQLDRRQHRLLISVTQTQQHRTQALDSTSHRQPPLAARQHQARDSAIQQVQTLDGHAAMIEVGQQIPLRTGYGPGFQYRQYQPVTTGFTVTPRRIGQEVHLNVTPWSDRLEQNQVIATQSAHMDISIPLGQWVELGGVRQTMTHEAWDLHGAEHLIGNETTQLMLKVDDLDANMP